MQVTPEMAAARAALEWQLDMGVDEAMSETPVNRYEVAKRQPKKLPKMGRTSNIQPVTAMPDVLPVAQSGAEVAALLSGRANTLDELRNAFAVFDHCALKKGARNLVFSDGDPTARVMVIGGAPEREEDQSGRPFDGRGGDLLDKMFAAIGLSRGGKTADDALYLATVLPWRPPQGRDPSTEELKMVLPFLERHVALADPDFVVLMGNTACQGVLGRTGVSRLRGKWGTAFGKPALPMVHPLGLLRDGLKKRDAWADLLSLQARLES